MAQTLATIATTAWAFGWEACVALATLALALVTWRLARSTRSLASSTREEAAATWRPVLTTPARIIVEIHGDDLLKFNVWVRNIGRGVALAIDVRLSLQQPGHFLSRGILDIGEDGGFEFEIRRPKPDVFELLIDYRDLGQRMHSTKATYRLADFSTLGLEQTPTPPGVEAFWCRLVGTDIQPERHLIDDKGSDTAFRVQSALRPLKG